MLTIQGSGARLCDQLTRRELLRIGSLGLLGLSLPELVRGRQTAAAMPGSASGPDKDFRQVFKAPGPRLDQSNRGGRPNRPRPGPRAERLGSAARAHSPRHPGAGGDRRLRLPPPVHGCHRPVSWPGSNRIPPARPMDCGIIAQNQARFESMRWRLQPGRPVVVSSVAHQFDRAEVVGCVSSRFS